jgi:hypothetical protein
MGAGLRPEAKAEDEPPDPTVRAPVLDPTGRGRLEKGSTQAEHLAGRLPHYAPRDHELARLEAEAKAARIGLWSQPNPVPPWNWRQGDGVPQAAGVIGNRRSHVYHKPSCRGGDEREEQDDVRQRGGGAEGRVSEGKGLLVGHASPEIELAQGVGFEPTSPGF